MPTLNIKSGDTLSKIAADNGTTVDAILSANQGNPSVKSANLIIAGGSLNLPGVEAPAGPTASGALPGGDAPMATGTATKGMGDLGNLRMALREALNEASR